jgi:hypothetical protein
MQYGQMNGIGSDESHNGNDIVEHNNSPYSGNPPMPTGSPHNNRPSQVAPQYGSKVVGELVPGDMDGDGDVDKHDDRMSAARVIDTYRVIPRAMVVAYCALVYYVVDWYMHLSPYFPEEVKHLIDKAKTPDPDILQLMVQVPNTQQAALVTAVVGAAAAIFGLYTNSGGRWRDK